MSVLPPTTAASFRREVLAAIGVGLACSLLLLATAPMLPMVWDEGTAVSHAERIFQWCALVRSGQPGAWAGATIDRHWPSTTQIEGHPSLAWMLVAAGRGLGDGWLSPLQAARLGPIVFWAVACGAVFWRLRRDYSGWAALGGVAALALQPRLFAHAHFASIDGPLCAAWLLAWAAFGPACRGGRWLRGLFGIALGLTLSVKFTGWLAPLPFVLWTALYRDRGGWKALAWGLPVALAVFVALNPPLWHAPLAGLGRFLWLNLHRAANPDLNISTQFLGATYNLDHTLPWYNTLFWTAVTVPLGLLILAGIGLTRIVLRRRSEPQGVLIALGWATLLVVRALPGVPPHDGIRLFLPSFALLALIVGVGVDHLRTWAAEHPLRGRMAAAVLLASSIPSLLWYAPQWLSYYNLALGGLRGATALGMEPTYYWDGLDAEVIDWLNQHTPPGEKVIFAAGPEENLDWLRHWGVVSFASREETPGEPRWYVLQHRPGAWQEVDADLAAHAHPVYEKVLRRGGSGPWRLDVPLVSIYRYDDYRSATAHRRDK